MIPTEIKVGPGTELKRLLRWFFIKDNGLCGCEQKAIVMDEWGPDECERRMDTILGWLREAAETRKLPFTELGAKGLVKLAIHRARKKLKILEAQK